MQSLLPLQVHEINELACKELLIWFIYVCHFRENVKHFFECFCEVVPPSDTTEPWIIQQFPEKYKDVEVLKSVPKFAYPYRIEKYGI